MDDSANHFELDREFLGNNDLSAARDVGNTSGRIARKYMRRAGGMPYTFQRETACEVISQSLPTAPGPPSLSITVWGRIPHCKTNYSLECNHHFHEPGHPPPMLTFGDRLYTALTLRGATPSALARHLGIKPQAIYQIRRGASKSMTGENLLAAARFLRVSPDWLATGAGPMESGPIPAQTETYSQALVSKSAWLVPSGPRVPVAGSASWTDNGSTVPLDPRPASSLGHIDIPTTDPGAYALRCDSDALAPRVRPGEYVIVEPGARVGPGDEVLVTDTFGRTMIQVLLFERDGRVSFASVNDRHRSSMLASDVASMHLISAIVKSTRWSPE